MKRIICAVIVIGLLGCRTMQKPEPEKDKHVTGVGGIFFKRKDPEAQKRWYAAHLGLQTDEWGTNFESRQADHPERKAFLQWSPHKETTKFFPKEFMINYRVQNLDRLIEQLKSEGIEIVGPVQTEPYGKFCHIVDPEGNKIELWEPDDEVYDKTAVKGRTK